MANSFFFYDLETSGFSPKEARIMQFAGQRTDLELKPIGEPVNHLLKLTNDILPDPDAVLVTGITPQATQTDGLTEREFLELFETTVGLPDTIYVGFNNIRFDDEFMRFLHYRNFYDPYEWQWQMNRSRWDLLDVVRMTRALRPVGIKWPFASDGSPSNRLELLSSLNGLDHEHAHDALNDVGATIAVARLIRSRQTKLFDYLLNLRNKKQVAELVLSGEPFIYTSGKYPSEYEKTSVAVLLAEHPKRPGALVYDLRYDPTDFCSLSPQALAEAWRWQKEPVSPRLPVKTMRFNTCPAIAPIGVLDKSSQDRLKLDLKLINKHFKQLRQIQADLVPKLLIALDILDGEQQTSLSLNVPDIDGKLYEGFFTDKDKRLMNKVRAASAEELQNQNFKFSDQRLTELLPLYKARNFARNLTEAEHVEWENFRVKKLLTGGDKSSMARYFARLKDISEQNKLSDRDIYLLEELQLYGQSIMPAETADA
jgi:exodeoxyribonuclease-1